MSCDFGAGQETVRCARCRLVRYARRRVCPKCGGAGTMPLRPAPPAETVAVVDPGGAFASMRALALRMRDAGRDRADAVFFGEELPTVDRAIHQLVVEAALRTGSMKEAARRLGMGKTSMYRWVRWEAKQVGMGDGVTA